MQDRMHQMPVEDVADLRQRLIDDARCKALSTLLLTNGVRNFRPGWIKRSQLL